MYLHNFLEHPQQIIGLETGGSVQPLADPPVHVLQYTRVVLTVWKSSVSVSVSDLISKYFCRDDLRQKKYNVGTFPANQKKIVGTLLEVLVLLREESRHFFLFCREKSRQNINFVETYLDKIKTPIPGNSRTRLGGHIGFSTEGRSTEGEGLNLIFLIYIQ